MNENESAFPLPQAEYASGLGLTKFEITVILIAAGISANPNVSHELRSDRIAEMAFDQAKDIFRRINK